MRRENRLTVALSGGVDSVVLLHIMRMLSSRYGFHLSALHVNHGISQNAAHWQAFCERLCDEWDIRLDVAKVVVQARGEGLEAAARRARYDAFADVRAEWLALAHHRDDQAETLLLNLLRGAGVVGAAAMPQARTLPGRPGLGILRPLLEVPRDEIEAFARLEGLSYRVDESNIDTRYSRNFVRHRIFPLLRERFPGCAAVLARAASHFSESQSLLEELARLDSRGVLHDGRIVSSRLAKMDEARARNLVRHVLQREGIRLPDSARLHEIVRQVCHAAPDSHLRFDLGEMMLHRYRGEVWLIPHCDEVADMEWRGESELQWGNALLRFRKTVGEGVRENWLARNSVRIALRRGGERLRPDSRRPRRELKKLLQENAVPPWERDRLPLLWCGNDLVWVPGIGIDCAWRCAPDEAGILPEYLPASF